MRSPAERNADGASDSSSSRTVRPSRATPTSWGMCATRPPTATSPSSGSSAPLRTPNSVLLPTPFAPTTPTLWPGEIRHETFVNSRSPPGCA